MLLQENSILKKLTPNDVIKELWKRGELRYKLKPGQLKYLDFVNNSKSMINVFHCSRGWGKTFFFIIYALMMAIKKPNCRIVYFCKSRTSAHEIFLPAFRLISEDAPKGLIEWSSYRHRINISNNSEIIVEGAEDDDDKLRGPYAHMIVCDEAGFWRNLKYAVNDIFVEQVRRRQGKIFITTTTPKSLAHDFYEYKNMAIKSDTYYTRDVRTNENITPAELEEEVEILGGWNSVTVRRELLNEDVVDTNFAVIPEFNKSSHVCDKKIPPAYRDVYISADFGFVRDNTHVLFGYWDFLNAQLIIEDELVFDNTQIMSSPDTMSEIVGKIGKSIREKRKELWTIGNNELQPLAMIADCPSHVLHDLQVTNKLDFWSPAKYDKEQAIHNLREAFANNKILFSPKCEFAIMQCERGIWNKKRTDYERLTGLGHLDAIDALLYMWRSIERNKNPVPRYVNAPMNNIHQYNEHMYRDTHSLDRLSDLYE